MYDSTFQNLATDEDLVRLGKSEHPLLRAAAFREMFERKSFNHFDILMEHLDDTAIIAVDAGEFGTWFKTVSDDILEAAVWKTQEEKNKTLEKVLTRHNYLRSAYIVLDDIEPQEKYYTVIKDMATRPRRLDYEGYQLGFRDIEYALFGLARFKKKDDVQIIKEQLMKNFWRLSHVSFRLMKEYPDTAYLDVLQTYHRKQFYRFSGQRRGGFSGTEYYGAEPEDFIEALAVQQNERSAKVFDTILYRLPTLTCMPDVETIQEEVVMKIWENTSPAYARLREKIKPKAETILKGRFVLTPLDIPTDTTSKVIRWYN